jgi:predicted acyltransferase
MTKRKNGCPAVVVLAIFPSSNWSARTQFGFMNVLAQIGLGCTFVFLLAGRGWKLQLGVGLALLAATWLAWFLHPAPSPDLDYSKVGVEPAAVLLVLWLVCLWMYRRKIFLKI